MQRLPTWSVLRLCVLSVVISGLPTTGIAQTKPPLVLFPGYVSTKLLVTVKNQTVAPECPASGTFGAWISSDQSNGFSPACRDKLMTLVYNRRPSVPMSQRFSEQPGVTVTIMDYGKIESCPCPFYEDLYALLEANGYTRNLDIRVAGYDWRLTPDMGGFLPRTIRLIEQTYADNGNTPGPSAGPLQRTSLCPVPADTYLAGLEEQVHSWVHVDSGKPPRPRTPVFLVVHRFQHQRRQLSGGRCECEGQRVDVSKPSGHLHEHL